MLQGGGGGKRGVPKTGTASYEWGRVVGQEEDEKQGQKGSHKIKGREGRHD